MKATIYIIVVFFNKDGRYMRYTIEKSIIVNYDHSERECFLILDNGIPEFIINNWIEMKSINSSLTGRQYAYTLLRYLNYLDIHGIGYDKATKRNVLQFIQAIISGDGNVFSLKSNIVASTADYYLGVIKNFYRYLEDYLNTGLSMRLEDKSRRASKDSYLYGQIWDMDTKEVLLENIIMPKEKKTYIKWYTDTQKDAILSNLNTKRDKTIFMLSLEGMRIDEILSLRLEDYKPEKKTIETNRSKGNKHRTVILREETVNYLEDYIFNERGTIEGQMGLKKEMFLNLRAGKGYGQPVKYSNILHIIKKAAENGGIDSKLIRTHSGRSSRTMELINHQAEHPEDNLTDAEIMLLMGWSSPSSMKPYVNVNDERTLKSTIEKINKKENKNNGNSSKTEENISE